MNLLTRLVVVIPVGSGDRAWRELLPQLSWLPPEAQLRLAACRAEDVDETCLRNQPGLPDDRCWLLASQGRAKQMNAAVAASSGEFLWFLHADTRLLNFERVGAGLQQALATKPDALSYFDLEFLPDGPRAMSINTIGARFRSRWLGLPFGDQGFLLSRATFERLGRFNEALSSAEDHALVWAARRVGVPLHAIGVPIATSARRYAEFGWGRTTLRHLRLTALQAWQFSGRRRRF